MSFFSTLFKSSKNRVDVLQLIENGAVIIDVRTPGEFKGGHIKDSYNFPLNTLSQNVKTLQSFHKPLVLVCKSGKRSETAEMRLKERGVECYSFGAWEKLDQKLHTVA